MLAAVIALRAACPGGAGETPGPATADEGCALHFLAGLAAGCLTAGAALPVVEDLQRGPAAAAVAAASSASALLVGGLKELSDLGGRGDPSWTDLGLTLLGGVCAGLLGGAASSLAADQPGSRGALSAACLCAGAAFALPVVVELRRRDRGRDPAATPSSAPRS